MKEDGTTECFGELYCLKSDNYGKWIEDIKYRISKLYCVMNGKKTSKVPNGINIIHKPDNNIDNDVQRLGLDIASFLVRSQITKRRSKISEEEVITYLTPVNIILDSIDRDYTTLINHKAVQNIITILNHPHFKGCNSIKEIQDMIPTVKDLNGRFKKKRDEEDTVQERSSVKPDIFKRFS